MVDSGQIPQSLKNLKTPNLVPKRKLVGLIILEGANPICVRKITLK